MKQLLFALRPKHWIKNFFIFLPLIFGKKLFVYPINLESVIAFILFCMASSTVYLINDIIDIEKDKIHSTKRFRPIASGKVSIKQGIFMAFILGILSITYSFMLNVHFGYVVIIYIIFNFIYSKMLKDLVIIDVFCIGVFFLLRLISGSIVEGVVLSHWIVVMTVLLTLFLGFNKRRQELMVLEGEAKNHRHVLNKYNLYFIDQMVTIVTSSIVVTYMLYTVDARTVNEFGTRNLIYSVPFVYYGIFRYLYLIYKIRKDGEPTRMFLSDRITQLNIALWITVCIVAIYFVH